MEEDTLFIVVNEIDLGEDDDLFEDDIPRIKASDIFPDEIIDWL
jgi:hypothetical protein